MKAKPFFMLIIFLASCSTSVQLINKGKYNEAIEVLVADLSKDSLNKKNIEALDFAFGEATKADYQKITSLKKSGKPEAWPENFSLYNQLNARQKKIETLPLITQNAIHYNAVDYKDLITESREKTCASIYANAMKLINSGKKADAQRAGFYLLEIESLLPGYKDVNKLLANIKSDTTVFVLYNISNQFQNYLPGGLENEIEKLEFSKFNTPKYEFISGKAAYLNIKYEAAIEIIDVKIAPEKTEPIYYTETATIQDGIAFKLDAAGNFLRDSLGNKIEVPKFKTIACYVTESVQKKSILIGGTVIIRDIETGKIVANRVVAGEAKFGHRSAKFKGDINALATETLDLLGSKELEFPSDFALILSAADKFAKNAADVVIEELEKLPTDLTKKE